MIGKYILPLAMIVLSLMLIGNGITGFVVMDPGIKEYCSSDYPCSSPEVCCVLYGETDKGVCSTADMCGKILQITQEQQYQDDELMTALYGEPSEITPIEKDEKLNESYSTQIMFGVLLFIIGMLNVLLEIEHRKLPEKKSRFEKSQ